MKNIIVIADFDETLIEQNTLIEVYRDLTDIPLAVSVMRAFFGGRRAWRAPRAAIKAEMYRRMLRGKSESDLVVAGREIARRVTLNPPVVSRVRQFSTQGSELIVASAALTQIVETILEEKGLGFSRVVATRAELDAGKLTGNLVEGECFGKIKAHRVREFHDTFHPGAYMVAFGNWPDDAPMLLEADEAYIVTGNTIKRFHDKNKGNLPQ
uniref:Haloacid Dehalogenase superfamily, subfamily IB, phosphoserine phosphatase-like n=1 Tax=Candidatus Kentrum sp. SD TaxID=2126332 RepID=A0A450YHS4_9GAMM|nr:MAG: Haloacid Dehalogenase superfamily, subfamily IB, phosphoserine phosphatase-like [Candidatus Kentron sp. SD]VFK41958.1 MAG: Haloacid Dehalogenase superfamily, subfamily IB, phosphoserine phosphatase-like [Candidatus Kentron sp. SD]VFK78882.1 MAG: Haloacid Dehalogenase superfamily, subfamily IB, phosphoserine phosphatase-like [Candidatus Kentron sp. SD]